MHQPELYEKANDNQKDGIIEILEEYFQIVKIPKRASIIDIGCGPGDQTYNLLRTVLPDDFEKFIGVDISEKMIQHANKMYGKNNCEFHKLNIEEFVPEKFLGKFDLVLSFYCLQWIQIQRQAFLNINKLLKKGGRLFCNLPTMHHLFDVYLQQSEAEKWKPYLNNVNEYRNPYQHVLEPEKDIRKLLIETGFKIHICEFKKVFYDYIDDKSLQDFNAAVNPFIEKIPQNLQEEYLQDFKDKFLKFSQNNNHVVDHDLVVIYATKQ